MMGLFYLLMLGLVCAISKVKDDTIECVKLEVIRELFINNEWKNKGRVNCHGMILYDGTQRMLADLLKEVRENGGSKKFPKISNSESDSIEYDQVVCTWKSIAEQLDQDWGYIGYKPMREFLQTNEFVEQWLYSERIKLKVLSHEGLLALTPTMVLRLKNQIDGEIASMLGRDAFELFESKDFVHLKLADLTRPQIPRLSSKISDKLLCEKDGNDKRIFCSIDKGTLLDGFTSASIDSISAQQWSLVPDEVFASIQPKHIKHIRPESLVYIRESQLKMISKKTLIKMNHLQIRLIGSETKARMSPFLTIWKDLDRMQRNVVDERMSRSFPFWLMPRWSLILSIFVCVFCLITSLLLISHKLVRERTPELKADPKISFDTL